MSSRKRLGFWAVSISVIVAVVSGSVPSNASNASETTAITRCTHELWKGMWYCGYPYDDSGVSDHYKFPNGTYQVWGVAARPGHPDDHKVFSKWRYSNGEFSSFADLGGEVYSKVSVIRSDGYALTIQAVGSDGDNWCRDRTPSGAWRSWYRC